jgi:hypothetical protein
MTAPIAVQPGAASEADFASLTSGRQGGDSSAVLTAILAYPLLRSVIDPQYRSLPADELESIMARQFGEGAAEEYEAYLEGFFGDVGHWVSHAASDVGRAVVKAAPVVANIGGGVLRGATAGASLGLPGIIGGAIAGGVGQGFSSYGSGTLRDIGQGLNTATNIAGQFSGTGRIGASLGGALSDVGRGRNVLGAASSAASGLLGNIGGGSSLGAAASALGGGRATGLASIAGLLGGGGGSGGAGSGLLALLGRPEMRQALGAMGLGRLGASSVPVGGGGTQVPLGAFANLLGSFAQSAADEQMAYSDGGEDKVAYLLDDAGEWAVDPAEPRERAMRLAQLLDAAQDEREAIDDALIRAQQAQDMQRQQDVLAAHQALLDQLQAVRARRAELARETEMLDAVDLVDAAFWTDTDEGFEEDLEAELEADAEYEEFDEYYEPISA